MITEEAQEVLTLIYSFSPGGDLEKALEYGRNIWRNTRAHRTLRAGLSNSKIERKLKEQPCHLTH